MFILIGGMAFWLLLFLMAFAVPYWITLGAIEQMRPKKVFDDEEEKA